MKCTVLMPVYNAGAVLTMSWVYMLGRRAGRLSSYTLLLAGGSVIVRGACGSELSAIVAGGPKPNPPCPAGTAAAAAGAVRCQSLAVPPGFTPVRSARFA